MLQKVSNVLLVICSIGIVLPQLLGFFTKDEASLLALIPWAWVILFSGVIGVLLQVVVLIKNKKKINLSGLFLLLSFLLLIIGFTLKELNLNFKTILLFGVLCFGCWFIIPSPKKSDNDSV